MMHAAPITSLSRLAPQWPRPRQLLHRQALLPPHHSPTSLSLLRLHPRAPLIIITRHMPHSRLVPPAPTLATPSPPLLRPRRIISLSQAKSRISRLSASPSPVVTRAVPRRAVPGRRALARRPQRPLPVPCHLAPRLAVARKPLLLLLLPRRRRRRQNVARPSPLRPPCHRPPLALSPCRSHPALFARHVEAVAGQVAKVKARARARIRLPTTDPMLRASYRTAATRSPAVAVVVAESRTAGPPYRAMGLIVCGHALVDHRSCRGDVLRQQRRRVTLRSQSPNPRVHASLDAVKPLHRWYSGGKDS